MYALYQVSVRQATISLSLLLAHISRCKPWESLWGSLATTPLVDFHHRLTACPSYDKKSAAYFPHSLAIIHILSLSLVGAWLRVGVIGSHELHTAFFDPCLHLLPEYTLFADEFPDISGKDRPSPAQTKSVHIHSVLLLHHNSFPR